VADGVTVSVVIPVKDDAPALRRCLELLAQQTVAPLEVVVVDNGSVDDSAAVATAYGARVVAEPTPGIPAAASTGYDAALGELIARCDADSAPPPDWVERMVRGMEGGGSDGRPLHALTGTGRFYDLPRLLAGPALWLYLGTFYLTVHAALGHTALWGSNMVFRRSTWLEVRDRVHRDDPELHDDIDLAFAFGPGRAIRYDRTVRVGVSARSLKGRRQRRRRLDRAFRTLRVNWAVQPPWERWQERLRLR
jgi:glycosyltransferase involved in cell wall biosynthesis